jgi:hypothetical protein
MLSMSGLGCLLTTYLKLLYKIRTLQKHLKNDSMRDQTLCFRFTTTLKSSLMAGKVKRTRAHSHRSTKQTRIEPTNGINGRSLLDSDCIPRPMASTLLYGGHIREGNCPSGSRRNKPDNFSNAKSHGRLILSPRKRSRNHSHARSGLRCAFDEAHKLRESDEPCEVFPSLQRCPRSDR